MPAAIPAIAIGAGAGAASAGIAGTSVLIGTLLGGGLSGIQYLTQPRQRDVGTQRNQLRNREVRFSDSPAWWVVGRSRVAGLEVDRQTVGSYQHRAYVLSHGATDGLEAVWLDGVRADLVAGSGGALVAARGSLVERFTAYPYLDGSGTGGASLRAASGRWTADHRLAGVSWVHLRLAGGGEEPEKVEFLVRGLRIAFPGQPEPIWTDSPAAIRFWWLTQRRGVAESDINRDSMLAAHGVCSRILRFRLPDALRAYPASSPTYAANGVVFADDDPESVEAELDYAWAGFVSAADGAFHFLPGAGRPVAWSFGSREIIEVESVQTTPTWDSRTNGLRQTLAQERTHDWVETSLPAVYDENARALDGADLVTDLRSRAFVSDAVSAGRLAVLALRREFAMRRQWVVRVIPGPNAAHVGVRPGDVARITQPDYGLDGRRLVVQAVTTLPDWSVRLSVRRDIDHSPAFVAPPAPPGRGGAVTGNVDPPGTDDPIRDEGDGYLRI